MWLGLGSLITNFINIGWGFRALQKFENQALQLTWLIALTTVQHYCADSDNGPPIFPILDFSNLKFLTVGRPKRAELRRCAKFGRNRSNKGRERFFFDFSKMAAVRHFEFVMCVFGPPTKGIWWSLSLCKFGWNRCSRPSFDNMHVFRFHEFGLKTPIHTPKGFWEILPAP